MAHAQTDSVRIAEAARLTGVSTSTMARAARAATESDAAA